jgi:hypothetical protein
MSSSVGGNAGLRFEGILENAGINIPEFGKAAANSEVCRFVPPDCQR